MIRTIILSSILALGTTGAAIAGCSGHSQQAMTCADGTVWDSATQTCIPLTSS